MAAKKKSIKQVVKKKPINKASTKKIPRKSKEFKYRYDEQQGIFIREDELSINWLLNQILESEQPLQITKISNEELQNFLFILSKSDLRMPDGKYCLFWLKDKIKERSSMADGNKGEVWDKISDRYRYILEQIDYSLITVDDIHEKMETKEIVEEKLKKLPNNMKAYFEPINMEKT